MWMGGVPPLGYRVRETSLGDWHEFRSSVPANLDPLRTALSGKRALRHAVRSGLAAGGRWIRTSSTRARSIWLSALLGGLCFAIGCGPGEALLGTTRHQRRGWAILAAGLGAAHRPSDPYSPARFTIIYRALRSFIRCRSQGTPVSLIPE